MGELASRMQVRIKKTSNDAMTFALKVLSGAILGLTFALAIHEAMGKQDGESVFSFLLVVVITTGSFLRIAKKWSLGSVLIFDLICVLIGMILGLYVKVAPGA